MKNIFENSETFTAFATMDAAEYMLRNIISKVPKNPIEKAIDDATGHTLEMIKASIAYLNTIKDCREKLEMPIDDVTNTLNELNEMKEKYTRGKEPTP